MEANQSLWYHGFIYEPLHTHYGYLQFCNIIITGINSWWYTNLILYNNAPTQLISSNMIWSYNETESDTHHTLWSLNYIAVVDALDEKHTKYFCCVGVIPSCLPQKLCLSKSMLYSWCLYLCYQSKHFW